jgi:hypothetical protein
MEAAIGQSPQALAFTIFVIWGQFTEMDNCVIRECNSFDARISATP